jgi:plastocyanin
MKRMLALLAALAVLGAVAVPALARTRSVTVKNFKFTPRSLTVSKGTTVRWSFRDSAAHNVKVTKGPAKFHSRNIKRGTYSKKLTRRGTYRIICTLHPFMHETVKVK